MTASYLTHLDPAARLGGNPIPMEHRADAAEPAVDLVNPTDISGAVNGGGWASVSALWRRVAGLPAPTLDLQLLLWDPVAGQWDEGAVISNVAPGQVVVFPVVACVFYIKIIGVHNVLGITSWQLLLRPLESV